LIPRLIYSILLPLQFANIPVKKNPVVDYLDDPEEISFKERLQMAWEAWIDGNKKLSIRKAAQYYGIDR
jgi:hypothetical protein